MKNILNLIIYLVCIVLIVMVCNNYLNKRRMPVKKEEPFKNFTKVERAIKNTSDWFRLNYKKLNFAK